MVASPRRASLPRRELARAAIAALIALAVAPAAGCFGRADATYARSPSTASVTPGSSDAARAPRRSRVADRCLDAAGRTKADCRRSRVVTVSTSIEILEPVSFIGNTAELDPASYRTIAAVAQSLLSNPSILLLEVRGHSDSSEHPELRAELAQRRAEVVADYIVAQGVDASRVSTYGASDDEPLYARNDIRNRRVEFLIVQRDD
jgi:outer membrane protein OmpA-like peptidoglycan-associated protein